jgi:hypothetical protein
LASLLPGITAFFSRLRLKKKPPSAGKNDGNMVMDGVFWGWCQMSKVS